jgi:hypothetical protein
MGSRRQWRKCLGAAFSGLPAISPLVSGDIRRGELGEVINAEDLLDADDLVQHAGEAIGTELLPLAGSESASGQLC